MPASTARSAQAITTGRTCGSCSAPTEFDPASGGLQCPYCGTRKAIPRAPVERHSLQEAANLDQRADDTLQEVKCTHCGARTTLAAGVTATVCAFCTSPLQRGGASAPPAEGVVPFEVTKETAGDHFRKWLAGLWFRPTALRRLARLSQIRGVYLPHWTFDADAFSEWTAEAGYYYYVDEVYVENGEEKTRRVQQIRWEPAFGAHEEQFTDVLVHASAGLSLKESEALAPFEMDTRLTRFDGDFLAGFEAEAHTLGVAECWPAAARQIQAAEHAACERLVPGDTHRALSVSTRTSNECARSVLLPTYVAAYEFNGKVYRIGINGQTGKIVGAAPWSFWKIAALVVTIAALAAGLYFYFSAHR
jgi:DNA-directed RNA polymerase subunit RPC12/RpoP